MLDWQRTELAAVAEFRDAPGVVEFTSDGTSVNTIDGWREMKIGIFSQRELGEPAAPDEWADRTLPKPRVAVSFAAIEASEDFGRRWKTWRKRLGLLEASAITVLRRRRKMDLGRTAETSAWGGRRTRYLPRPGTHRGDGQGSALDSGRQRSVDRGGTDGTLGTGLDRHRDAGPRAPVHDSGCRAPNRAERLVGVSRFASGSSG